jgi:hypothetical protein
LGRELSRPNKETSMKKSIEREREKENVSIGTPKLKNKDV